jgi:hypothetical protein
MATQSKTIPAISATFHTATGTECAVNETPVSMRLTYSDGEVMIVTREDIEAHGLLLTFAWHGAKQKHIDAAAISRDPETGRAATVETKRRAVAEVYERITRGEWFKAREGVATGGLLLTALCRMYAATKTREDVEAYLGTLTDKQKSDLRGNPRVAKVIAEIRAERAADGETDSEALLAGLDA